MAGMTSTEWRALLDQQHGIVTEAQAAQHGVTAASIESRVRRGLYQRVGSRTVATFASSPAIEAIEAAACLANPSAYLSHFSAGRRWRLQIAPDCRAHIVVPVDARTARGARPRSTSTVKVHRSRHLVDADLSRRNSLPMTSLERTLIDLFAVLPTADARRSMLAEAFRTRRTNQHRVTQSLLRLPQLGRRGELVDTIELCAGGSQSSGEMRLFAFVASLELPAAVVRQHRLRVGAINRYLDIAVPTHRLAIEYDGAHHLTDAQRDADLDRDHDLRKIKWQTVRVTAQRLRDGDELADVIWHELAEQAARLGMPVPSRPIASRVAPLPSRKSTLASHMIDGPRRNREHAAVEPKPGQAEATRPSSAGDASAACLGSTRTV